LNIKVTIIAVVGTLFIIFLGTALHFTYALSGNNIIVGSFSAINESVWEHLKLPFWPALLWTIIEMTLLRKTIGNLLLSRVVGAYFTISFIPIVFYS
jgi:hypothetical protein